MNKIIRFLTLILVTVSFSACEINIEFPDRLEEKYMVFYSLADAGKPVLASVGESVFFLDDVPIQNWRKDATVSLYINGEFIEHLKVYDRNPPHQPVDGDEYYKSDAIVHSGDEVRIEASLPDFDEVASGSTTVPHPTLVADVKVISLVPNENGNGYYGKLQITFSDDKNSNDYYWVSAKKRAEYYPEHPDWPVNWADVKYEDKIFAEKFDYIIDAFGEPKRSYSYGFFDDRSINGIEKYPLTLGFYHNPEVSKGPLTFDISLCTIDENYYKYLKSYRQSFDNSVLQEPVQVHSNIKNGIGLVGSKANSISEELYQFDVAKKYD